MKLRKGDALVVVDVQHDFTDPKGSLYVQGAEKIFPVVRSWINTFAKEKLPIFFTKDWHPADHISFKSEENPSGWPSHCVQKTWGAEIPEEIPYWRATAYSRNGQFQSSGTILKGREQDTDEYSGFAPEDGLGRHLGVFGVRRIFVVGLATDYCVKATVLDGLDSGFEVIVVTDAIAGVDVKPGDVDRAIKEMTDAGAKMI